MKLKNNSARPHWIGDVLIAPGTIGEVGDEWHGAYNKSDLAEVVEEAQEKTEEKHGRKKKAD